MGRAFESRSPRTSPSTLAGPLNLIWQDLEFMAARRRRRRLAEGIEFADRSDS